jgi:hypothetical protein
MGFKPHATGWGALQYIFSIECLVCFYNPYWYEVGGDANQRAILITIKIIITQT